MEKLDVCRKMRPISSHKPGDGDQRLPLGNVFVVQSLSNNEKGREGWEGGICRAWGF